MTAKKTAMNTNEKFCVIKVLSANHHNVVMKRRFSKKALLKGIKVGWKDLVASTPTRRL